jgi:hypothetical protein
MTDVEHLEARVDEATTRLLVPLRMTKTVDSVALADLTLAVAGLTEIFGVTDSIPRVLVGKLWFVFTQMLLEAEHANDPDPILDAAWVYEDTLTHLFEPRF